MSEWGDYYDALIKIGCWVLVVLGLGLLVAGILVGYHLAK